MNTAGIQQNTKSTTYNKNVYFLAGNLKFNPQHLDFGLKPNYTRQYRLRSSG